MYFCALFKRVGFINCCCSSVVEHFLGKEEVVSSSLINSSQKADAIHRVASAFVM